MIANFQIKDDRFDIGQIDSKTLILEFQISKFVFIVRNNENKSCEWLEEYHIEYDRTDFKELWDNHLFLSANFWSKIIVIVHASLKEIIPKSLFEEDNLSIYFGGEKRIAGDLNFVDLNTKSAIVYEINKVVSAILNRSYKKEKLFIIPLEKQLPYIKNGLNFHFEKNMVNVSIFINGECEQSKMVKISSNVQFQELCDFYKSELKEDITVNAIGEITPYSSYFMVLESTFENFELKINMELNLNNQYFEEVPKHKYFTIFNNF